MLKSFKTTAKTVLLAFIFLVSIQPALNTQAEEIVVIVRPEMGESFDALMQTAQEAYIDGFHGIEACNHPQFSSAHKRLRDLYANAYSKTASLTETSRQQMAVIDSINNVIAEADSLPSRLEGGPSVLSPHRRSQLEADKSRQVDEYAKTIQAITEWDIYAQKVKKMADDLASKWEDLCIKPKVDIFMGGDILVPVEVIGVTGEGGTGEGGGGEGEEEGEEEDIDKVALLPGVEYVEVNYCRDKQEVPNDPYFHSSGSWGQAYSDQWAIKHVGFTGGKDSAWNIEDGTTNPIVVAVIDTGLDWNHKDINWDNIWTNENEIPDNGIDDDDNGYVDDKVGWNFIGNNSKPWDEDGHGTFVAGVIAAATNNEVGIAGINRGAKIMVLKALNAFGHTRASFLSEAIFYAANNGARVINISVGGKHLTRSEQEAIYYAHDLGAVVIAAAGNEAVDTVDYSPAGLRDVITVTTTDNEDKRASFSNWGQGIDIAAPGMDVLSLRARRTDLMLGIPGVPYTPRLAYVGKDTRYYRASGSSFSAPIVAATASLILAKDPTLTNTEVERMLVQSTRDVELPGWDQHTGYGLLDARAALEADPNYYLIAKINKVQPVQEGGKTYLEVVGTVDGNLFDEAWVEIGLGERPESWIPAVSGIKKPVVDGRVALVSPGSFTQRGKWIVRLMAKDKDGKTREAWSTVNLE